MHNHYYYIYIITNYTNRVIYTGMTSNLSKRIWEHRRKEVPGFTAKYNVTKLIYFEETGDVMSAFEREKQIKGWTRAKKIKLIETINPNWRDLFDELEL